MESFTRKKIVAHVKSLDQLAQSIAAHATTVAHASTTTAPGSTIAWVLGTFDFSCRFWDFTFSCVFTVAFCSGISITRLCRAQDCTK
mmetsp:Transcript_78545/g.115019  ORF Transcript_78545/g.115019 Transcript_78545/m.115019 type:complete len:87 (+) Transcript_78545:142-402(+)